MMLSRLLLSALAFLLSGVAPAVTAQGADSARAVPVTAGCADCPAWNAPRQPFRLHGNAHYVGTDGLSAVLLTSSAGHVLIDGGLPESAPVIRANIARLGFRIEDVRLILNSHAHFDHAGGIAELQRASGAEVAATAWSAAVLRTGTSRPDDPQHGILPSYPAVARVRVIADGDTVRVGPIALVAHLTPGHTPGGTSWAWRSCEQRRCLDLVYAGSQTPVSANGFLFSGSRTYPAAVADFERSFALLERVRCDLLITPHPGASGLWERVTARDAGRVATLADREGCRRYAASARQRLAQRLGQERARR